MTKHQQMILVFSLLLLQAYHEVNGLDLGHSFPSTSVPAVESSNSLHAEAESFSSPPEVENSLILPAIESSNSVLEIQSFTSLPEAEGFPSELRSFERGHGKTVYSNGILWNLLPEDAESSSNYNILSSNVHCTKEGLNPVPGSCKNFVYCRDLSDEGLEEWYIILFTCPDNQFFDVSSAKCRNHSLSTGHPECQPGTELEIKDEVFISSSQKIKELREGFLLISNITHQMSVETPENSPEQDAGDCEDVDHIKCNIPGKEGLGKSHDINLNEHIEKKPQLLNFREQVNRSGTEDRPTFGIAEDVFQDRSKRSVTTLENAVEIISQSAQEVCENIETINIYVEHVRSSKPLAFSYSAEDMLKTTIVGYNQNLKSAQTNTNSWDKDNGILKAVTHLYKLIEEFGPNFEIRFLNMTTTIANILKQEVTEINIYHRSVSVLKDRIEEYEELMKSVESEFILKYLKHSLEQDRLELSKMIKVEFQHLTQVLEYVLKKSKELQIESSKAKRLMESFQTNIYRDRSNFNMSISRAKTSKKVTENMIKSNEEEIAEHLKKINRSTLEMTQKYELINVLEREIRQHVEQREREIYQMERRAMAARQKVRTGENLMMIPIFGWIAGGIMIGEGIEEHNRAIHRINEAIQSIRYQIEIHYRTVSSLEGIIVSERAYISTLLEKTAELKRKITALQDVFVTFLQMEKKAKSVLPIINSAVSSLVSLDNVFETVEEELTQVKDKADSAKTNAELQDADFFLYQAIVEKIKVPWEGAIYKIISVEDCVT